MSRETLGAYVRRVRKEKHLSCADVSDRSARFGKRISASYINRIENHPNLKVTADRLKALAHGLDVPADELLASVIREVTAADAEALRFLARFRELSPARKADVLRIIELWH